MLKSCAQLLPVDAGHFQKSLIYNRFQAQWVNYSHHWYSIIIQINHVHSVLFIMLQNGFWVYLSWGFCRAHYHRLCIDRKCITICISQQNVQWNLMCFGSQHRLLSQECTNSTPLTWVILFMCLCILGTLRLPCCLRQWGKISE